MGMGNLLPRTSEKLLSYLDKGKTEKFKEKLLSCDIDERTEVVNFKVGNLSCVLLTCLRDYRDVMSFLIEDCGIDPNMVVNEKGETILMYACIRRKYHVAKCLIEHGAEVNRRFRNGRSCLQSYFLDNNISMLLVQNGANIEHWRDENTRRPIIFSACETGNVDLFQFLLNHKVNVNVKDKDGRTPIEATALALYISSEPMTRSKLLVIDKLMKNSEIQTSVKNRAAKILFCKSVKSYLLDGKNKSEADDQTADLFWKSAINDILRRRLSRLNIFESYLPENIEMFTSEFYMEHFKDLSSVFIVSVNMMFDVCGVHSEESVKFIKHIAKWYSGQHRKTGQFVNFLNNVFRHISTHYTEVSQNWVSDFLIVLVFLVRSHTHADEDLCNITSEATCWVIRKLSELTSKRNIPLDAVPVTTLYVILKNVSVWVFSNKERRNSFLKKLILEIMHANFSYQSESFLHFGVFDYFSHVRRGNCGKAITCLLENGMEGDVTDGYGNTALTLLLQNFEPGDSMTEDLIKAILQYFHLDFKTKRGKSALDMLREKGFHICEIDYLSLQCLAAETIKRHNIPYHQYKLPTSLASFIDMH